MNCDVVRDLIPLYLDGCASPGSVRAVEEHTDDCAECRACLERAGAPLPEWPLPPARTLGRVSQWRASMLQSALFFVYFGILTLGVAKEAGTPQGLLNGFWGCSVVVPAAGFLLGLANWYFIRLYPSRRSFVLGSVLCTAASTAGCFAWALWHYEFPVLEFLTGYSLRGMAFIALNLALSGLLSRRYAALTGKE